MWHVKTENLLDILLLFNTVDLIRLFLLATYEIWEVLVFCREKWKHFFAHFHFLGLFMTK
jgi:hypothetical protein